MSWNESRSINVAVLDMNAGFDNQGMRCIKDIVTQWAAQHNYNLNMQEFEVRLKEELPGTEFDVYISSGGPGSPLESEGTAWENSFFDWLHQIEDWNTSDNFPKKHVFFICHSFQLVSRHYKIGTVCKRKSTSFGVFPIHRLDNHEEDIFGGLKDPFYAVDSRDYQLISPDLQRINEMGATLLAIEKERMHVPYERAVMAVRFNDYFVGTQFHPEADAKGMSMYLQRDDKKKMVIENHGEAKWASMVEQLNDPGKILSTYSHILPNFLNQAVLAFENQTVPAVA
ncbi:GMP synthase [Segetibacter sp. 3557_3]|uniref:type 1 glutamine amidotransferase n=1 Tax=Segetibacter sp. 3557_3 TaxID=2547429 RepID=UPI0010585214|nr:GMP synthase [Segetibacter sp. 3557_3]TDH28066.1 GMP synthase [Segetibacter sp. 3557_3]